MDAATGNEPDAAPRPNVRPYPLAARMLVQRLRRWRMPRLGTYEPRSTLALPTHRPLRAAVTAIDFHTHLGRWFTPTGDWMEGDVSRLLADMEASGTAALVNLDGRWGRELEENLDRYDRAHPERFFTFCHVDWRLLEETGGPDRLAESLRRSVTSGARGLKVWKDLGLHVAARGRRLLPDDPMLDPLWETAAEAGIPVLVHVADPIAFFLPADRHNERLEELVRNPHGTRHPGGAEELDRLLDAFEHLVASHPRTTFVAAHAGCPHNLPRVSGMLDRYANLRIDIGAVASELGRQPRAARALLTGHPDRVLFGTDSFPRRLAVSRIYFRLLETADEAFDYADDPAPPCGRWPIYGLDLPLSVLAQVYRDNAAVLLGLPGTAEERRVARAVS